jgi:hypothetical protein
MSNGAVVKYAADNPAESDVGNPISNSKADVMELPARIVLMLVSSPLAI